jgi:hypothetical protein
MSEVYLLVGVTSYEKDSIVRAYLNERTAEDEAKRLNEILKDEPRCPHSDAEQLHWDDYEACKAAWEERFKGHTWCEQFAVRPTELV